MWTVKVIWLPNRHVFHITLCRLSYRLLNLLQKVPHPRRAKYLQHNNKYLHTNKLDHTCMLPLIQYMVRPQCWLQIMVIGKLFEFPVDVRPNEYSCAFAVVSMDRPFKHFELHHPNYGKTRYEIKVGVCIWKPKLYRLGISSSFVRCQTSKKFEEQYEESIFEVVQLKPKQEIKEIWLPIFCRRGRVFWKYLRHRHG